MSFSAATRPASASVVTARRRLDASAGLSSASLRFSQLANWSISVGSSRGGFASLASSSPPPRPAARSWIADATYARTPSSPAPAGFFDAVFECFDFFDDSGEETRFFSEVFSEAPSFRKPPPPPRPPPRSPSPPRSPPPRTSPPSLPSPATGTSLSACSRRAPARTRRVSAPPSPRRRRTRAPRAARLRLAADVERHHAPEITAQALRRGVHFRAHRRAQHPRAQHLLAHGVARAHHQQRVGVLFKPKSVFFADGASARHEESSASADASVNARASLANSAVHPLLVSRADRPGAHAPAEEAERRSSRRADKKEEPRAASSPDASLPERTSSPHGHVAAASA